MFDIVVLWNFNFNLQTTTSHFVKYVLMGDEFALPAVDKF